MKRISTCACLLYVALGGGTPARSAIIDAVVSGFDEAEQAVLDHVIGFWEQAIVDPLTVNIAVSMLSIASGNLAESFGFTADAAGRPSGASIRVDDRSGSSFPWFVDPTPAENEEYRAGSNESHFIGIRPGLAGENYDLLTVLHHEMAHVMGFSVQFAGFAANVEPLDFDRAYAGKTVSATLTAASEGTHLSDFYHPFDLLNAFQGRGARMLPSDLDLAILADAFGYRLNITDPAPIPEPGTFYLTGSVLFWAVLQYRRGCRTKKLAGR